MNVHNYAVCVPYYGNPAHRHRESVLNLVHNHGFAGAHFTLHGCPYIDQARSVLAELALTNGFDGLLFIDHDIVFRAEDAIQVIAEAHARQAIVGAGYSMRANGEGHLIGGFAPEVTQASFFEGGAVHPALYLGMGFTAIPRSALLDIKAFHTLPSLKCLFGKSMGVESVTPWFALGQWDNTYWGEDVSFCRRARDASVPMFLDSRVRIGHIGTYEYHVEDGWLFVPHCPTLEVDFKPPS